MAPDSRMVNIPDCKYLLCFVTYRKAYRENL